MPRQVKREEEEAKKREGDEARGGLPVGLEHGMREGGGVEVEGMATGRCPKTRLCYCPPTPFSVAPNSDFDTRTHRHTHTRPRIPGIHAANTHWNEFMHARNAAYSRSHTREQTYARFV